MKVGDVVRLVGTFSNEKIGLIVSSSEFGPGWHTVISDDVRIHWPESQMEVVSETR